MKKRKITYTAKELICNVCEKDFRSSDLNKQKLKNCGIIEGKKYRLFDNYYICFYASHDGIRKIFYKKDRIIKKSTVVEKLETKLINKTNQN